MRVEKLDSMTKGWFVGDFAPTLYRTDAVEVAVKHYNEGEYEKRHCHRIATELTVVVAGTIRMNGLECNAGDIVIVEPGESTDFLAVTDAINAVVKLPGAKNDKYLEE